jgi:chorismate synthase
MIRFLTAGESHGPALSGIVEGLPANLPVDINAVNHQLYRRMQGYGRGGRMKIETDQIEVLSGLRFGLTIGSPVSFIIRNRDWENWTEEMAQFEGQSRNRITKPRPGHADLAGALKYGFNDIRNVLERSSARETAMRVAAGAFARELLKALNVQIYSHVLQIGQVRAEQTEIDEILRSDRINELADRSEVRCLDPKQEARMIEHIHEIKRQGDTVGGLIEIIVRGMPPGIGSYVQWDRRLEARLSAALISIQAVKGVEFGIGFDGVALPGSAYHDEIFYSEERHYYHGSNRAGGIEGGMTSGEDIVIRIAKKPIPTLMKPLISVDMESKEPFKAHKERSDITAVPACSVIAENVIAPVLADALMEKFGSDNLPEIIEARERYLQKIGIKK